MSETDCQPDFTKIQRFRVVEGLSQEDVIIGRDAFTERKAAG